MLLAIDVGNSNTVLGFFEGKKLLKTIRVASITPAIESLRKKIKKPFCHSVNQIVISSVVPTLHKKLKSLCRILFKKEPRFVSHTGKMPIQMRTKNPSRVGIDRIVNAIAAHEQWPRKNILVVDFGTATTFDVVTSSGDFLGGVITPGIKIMNEALFEKCAQLPRLKIQCPTRVIGKDTKSAIQSGIFFGYLGLVEGLITRIEKEFGQKLWVVSTGGLAPLIAKKTSKIHVTDSHLTLKGLQKMG